MMEPAMRLGWRGLLMALLLCPMIAFASWSGPETIIQGGWGPHDDQFGFSSNEIADQFPRDILVISSGRIIIADWQNDLLKIYNSDGTLMKAFSWPGQGMVELDSERIVCFKWNEKTKTERIGVVSLTSGEWLWVDKDRAFNSSKATVVVEEGKIFVWDGLSNGYQYSTEGKQLKTHTVKPEALGLVKRVKAGLNKFRYTVRYPGKIFSFASENKFSRLAKDSAGYVYGTTKVDRGEEFGAFQVSGYSLCGKLMGEVRFPVTRFEPVAEEKQRVNRERPRAVINEYGEPVIAPNGDVYAWKRTPDSYGVLKWTRRDDPAVLPGPDAPEGLTVTTSDNGLSLTWKASPQDPGCVTGYEIDRAPAANGPYTALAVVEAGKRRYTDATATAETIYYYRVRARAGHYGSSYTPAMLGVKGE